MRSKKILNKEQMEKILFTNLNEKKIKESKKIKKIADKNSVIYLDKLMYACDFSKKICFATDTSSNLINYDKTHISAEGAKFFGNNSYLKNFFKN